jgi:hypothetical protein
MRDALCGDITNGTFSGAERAIAENRFAAVVGDEGAPALLYIFKTLKALMHGTEAEIREAFHEPPPEDTSFIGYNAQI